MVVPLCVELSRAIRSIGSAQARLWVESFRQHRLLNKPDRGGDDYSFMRPAIKSPFVVFAQQVQKKKGFPPKGEALRHLQASEGRLALERLVELQLRAHHKGVDVVDVTYTGRCVELIAVDAGIQIDLGLRNIVIEADVESLVLETRAIAG